MCNRVQIQSLPILLLNFLIVPFGFQLQTLFLSVFIENCDFLLRAQTQLSLHQHLYPLGTLPAMALKHLSRASRWSCLSALCGFFLKRGFHVSRGRPISPKAPALSFHVWSAEVTGVQYHACCYDFTAALKTEHRASCVTGTLPTELHRQPSFKVLSTDW